MDIKHLFAEFPKEDIHWRSQSLTKDGDKALALAYVDARDVMDRLDDVCGAENWQDRYEVHGGKTICYLSIKIGEEWITKADGAGDTQVEAEKGSLSDAFKRAAVKWGIGRYLYDLPTPWVPCDTYEAGGKKRFSNFKESPWNYIRSNTSSAEQKRIWESMKEGISSDLLDAKSIDDCRTIFSSHWTAMQEKGLSGDQWKSVLTNHIKPRKNEIEAMKEAAE